MQQGILKTGFKELDVRWDGGIKRGELVVAYSSVLEKRAFLSQMLINMLSFYNPLKCLYFTFGESKAILYKQLVSIKSGVGYWYYCNRENRHEKEAMKIEQTQQWLNKKLYTEQAKPLVIDNAYTLAEILLCVAEQKASLGLDVIFIDGLCFLKDYANEDIRYALSILKDLSARLDIAVIVGDCLRYDKNRSPIEQIQNKYVFLVADKVMLAVCPEIYATAKQIENGEVVKGWVDFRILKNQTGERGFFSLKFDVGTMRFYNPCDGDIDKQEPPFEDWMTDYFIEKEKYL